MVAVAKYPCFGRLAHTVEITPAHWEDFAFAQSLWERSV
jgi:hypothetical protein